MALDYRDLDQTTRHFMVDEIDMDVANGSIYLSSWLSEAGIRDWPMLLRQAAESHDDDWLAHQLRGTGRLHESVPRRKPKGGYTTARVPITAPETMAEGEFNRFYVRGLCRRAIKDGVRSLVIYRAKQVASPRPESEQKLGVGVDPNAILADLRATQGVEPALGVPPGPNSGLTVKLP